MDTLDTEAMIQRFQERAKAVRKRNMPPVADGRAAFIKQAELDFQDFAIIGDAEASLDDGILTIDLRPAICDATVRGVGISNRAKERETRVAMENISKSEALPTNGDKITPKMLDSKADLQALIDGAEMFRVVETIEPIDVNACPGLDLANYDDQIERIVPTQRVSTERITPVGFSLTHGYLV
jgi:hypothetical protein